MALICFLTFLPNVCTKTQKAHLNMIMVLLYLCHTIPYSVDVPEMYLFFADSPKDALQCRAADMVPL